jgi:hypothetical protein
MAEQMAGHTIVRLIEMFINKSNQTTDSTTTALTKQRQQQQFTQKGANTSNRLERLR